MNIENRSDIQDPADYFSFEVYGIGVQVYRPQEVAPNKFEWSFK